MFLPKYTHKPVLMSWCRWCCASDQKKRMFKVRNGPVDWFFCNEAHADQWFYYRHKPETWALCRMQPEERSVHLQGRSMEDEISRLMPRVASNSG